MGTLGQTWEVVEQEEEEDKGRTSTPTFGRESSLLGAHRTSSITTATLNSSSSTTSDGDIPLTTTASSSLSPTYRPSKRGTPLILPKLSVPSTTHRKHGYDDDKQVITTTTTAFNVGTAPVDLSQSDVAELQAVLTSNVMPAPTSPSPNISTTPNSTTHHKHKHHRHHDQPAQDQATSPYSRDKHLQQTTAAAIAPIDLAATGDLASILAAPSLEEAAAAIAAMAADSSCPSPLPQDTPCMSRLSSLDSEADEERAAALGLLSSTADLLKSPEGGPLTLETLRSQNSGHDSHHSRRMQELHVEEEEDDHSHHDKEEPSLANGVVTTCKVSRANIISIGPGGGEEEQKGMTVTEDKPTPVPSNIPVSQPEEDQQPPRQSDSSDVQTPDLTKGRASLSVLPPLTNKLSRQGSHGRGSTTSTISQGPPLSAPAHGGRYRQPNSTTQAVQPITPFFTSAPLLPALPHTSEATPSSNAPLPIDTSGTPKSLLPPSSASAMPHENPLLPNLPTSTSIPSPSTGGEASSLELSPSLQPHPPGPSSSSDSPSRKTADVGSPARRRMNNHTASTSSSGSTSGSVSRDSNAIAPGGGDSVPDCPPPTIISSEPSPMTSTSQPPSMVPAIAGDTSTSPKGPRGDALRTTTSTQHQPEAPSLATPIAASSLTDALNAILVAKHFPEAVGQGEREVTSSDLSPKSRRRHTAIEPAILAHNRMPPTVITTDINNAPATRRRSLDDSASIPSVNLPSPVFDSSPLSPWSSAAEKVHSSKWPLIFNDERKLAESWPILTDTDNNVRLHIDRTGEILVRVVTWNQEAKPTPSPQVLQQKLLPKNKYHIYIVGTQECEHTIATSVVNQSKFQWETTLRNTFGKSYEVLLSHTLQATHLIVFVHKAITPLLKDLKSSAVPCGIGQTLGNKGGIGVTFTVSSTSFLFITSHLAAGQKAAQLRNHDYTRIATELVKALAPPEKAKCTNINEAFDRVIWCGDLNYRINGTRRMVDKLLDKNMHEVLLSNDQLNVAMKEGAVFQGFLEGPLHFRPTYKYDKNSDVYDTSSKQRVPAWTDRILFKPEGVQLLSYNCIKDIRSSDHRPVVASFKAKVDLQELPEAAITTNHHRSEVCTIS